MSDPGPSRLPASSRLLYYRDPLARDQAPPLKVSSTFKPWWTGERQPAAPDGKTADPLPPYELKTVVKANTKGKYYPSPSQCIEFFPFVGPKRPKATRDNRSWDQWEDAAVICSGPKVFVGRCADDSAGACWVPIWQFTIERQKAEDLYHVTWTINPFTLQPVVIAGGELGLIYVLDPVGKKLVKILKGHGDHVQALAICPTMPHILASGSRDHTTRIWNLYGHEVELPPGQLPHQNYPMGDADEGNHIVAILCGNWPGGHRDAVCAVSWLPTHRAISTASRDNAFKVWALPILPPPIVPKPDRDYRPVLVHLPLFSTNRISKGPIDSFMWLNEDIVVARCVGAVVTFQWLSYRRYFERGTWAPLGDSVTAVPDSVQWHDINDSRSIMIFSTYKVKGKHTYQRAGFHSAFTPTPDERESFVGNPNLVQGFLVAIPRPGVIPEIILYAPALAPPDPTPRLRRKLRVDNEDLSDDEEIKKERESVSASLSKGADSRVVGPVRRSPPSSTIPKPPKSTIHPPYSSPPDVSDGKESPDESSDSGTVSESDLSRGSVVDSDLDDDDEDDDPRRGPFDSDGESRDVGSSDRSSPIASPSSQDERPASTRHTPHSKLHQYQWRLKADIWAEIVEKHANKGYPLALGTRHESVISCCAISPRGARWVLGVGDAESIFVWRVKDT